MSTTTANPEVTPNARIEQLISKLRSPFKMRLFYAQRLPTLLWWGVRVDYLTLEEGRVSVPYGWRTQNPFKSTYFAAQTGAAELSTGLLAMLAIEEKGHPVSMLITKVEAEYTKKATQKITFTCRDGGAIREAVAQAITSGTPQTIQVLSVGVQTDGTEVSRNYFTWSFRAK